ncbi:hypothetical protein Q3G72_007859 [Acer saccharum]|nr:hypothetical protein Q3G72_007859 [Acer saccharum]
MNVKERLDFYVDLGPVEVCPSEPDIDAGNLVTDDEVSEPNKDDGHFVSAKEVRPESDGLVDNEELVQATLAVDDMFASGCSKSSTKSIGRSGEAGFDLDEAVEIGLSNDNVESHEEMVQATFEEKEGLSTVNVIDSEEELVQDTIAVEKKIVGGLTNEAEGRETPGPAYAFRKKGRGQHNGEYSGNQKDVEDYEEQIVALHESLENGFASKKDLGDSHKN